MTTQKKVYSSNDNQKQTYSINDIHIKSITTLPTPKGSVITKFTTKDIPNDEESILTLQPPPIGKTLPFPHRISQLSIPIENHFFGEFLNQLNKMAVKISLLDDVKEIMAYTEAIKESCIK